jgi:hypothetical protein
MLAQEASARPGAAECLEQLQSMLGTAFPSPPPAYTESEIEEMNKTFPAPGPASPQKDAGMDPVLDISGLIKEMENMGFDTTSILSEPPPIQDASAFIFDTVVAENPECFDLSFDGLYSHINTGKNTVVATDML